MYSYPQLLQMSVGNSAFSKPTDMKSANTISGGSDLPSATVMNNNDGSEDDSLDGSDIPAGSSPHKSEHQDGGQHLDRSGAMYRKLRKGGDIDQVIPTGSGYGGRGTAPQFSGMFVGRGGGSDEDNNNEHSYTVNRSSSDLGLEPYSPTHQEGGSGLMKRDDLHRRSETSSELTRKQRHNLREQRRIKKISEQFNSLRNLLIAAGCVVKKEKYNILTSTIEYVKQLERQAHDAQSAREQLILQLQQVTGSHSVQPLSSFSGVPEVLSPHGRLMPETVAGSSISYKNLFTDAGIPMAVCGLDGVFLECNKLFAQVLGLDLGEIVTRSIYSICSPMDLQQTYEMLGSILSGQSMVMHSRMRWISRAGMVLVFVTLSVVRDDNGAPVCLHCAALPMKQGDMQ